MTVDALTIEELATRAGMTVRNVRNYQTKGLLPPPELRGRKGCYSSEHLARLELIKEMQAAGFNLGAIKALLDRIPKGVGEEALLLERSLLSPWTDEGPEVVDAQELAERFGDPGPDVFERAQRIGVIRLLDDGRVELPAPALVRAGEQVMALGVPIEEVLAVTEQLVANSNRIAAAYVDLFLRNIWSTFDEEGRPAERWPQVRRALDGLKPLATEALVAAFQARMTEAVEQAFGSQLEPTESDEATA